MYMLCLHKIIFRTGSKTERNKKMVGSDIHPTRRIILKVKYGIRTRKDFLIETKKVLSLDAKFLPISVKVSDIVLYLDMNVLVPISGKKCFSGRNRD